MRRTAHQPWLRSSEESVARNQRPAPRATALELLAVGVVVVAVAAMAIWFLFFSSGGIGPGTI
jgi:hypothetical protein